MAREADHLQITALVSLLNVPTVVCYLDASTSTTPTMHTLPDGCTAPPLVHLLYRPGHYDILVPV